MKKEGQTDEDNGKTMMERSKKKERKAKTMEDHRRSREGPEKERYRANVRQWSESDGCEEKSGHSAR
jgi:hypothetical protein